MKPENLKTEIFCFYLPSSLHYSMSVETAYHLLLARDTLSTLRPLPRSLISKPIKLPYLLHQVPELLAKLLRALPLIGSY